MRKGRTLTLVGAALLTACHGDSSQAPVEHPVTHVRRPLAPKPGPSPEELTAGMVEAATIGKSTVPVAVKFDLEQRPTVGQPLEVVVAVMPQILADLAVLTVENSSGLQIAPGTGPIEMPAVDTAQVYRQTIKLTPTQEGVQLLGLNVALKHDDITETRVFSVPMIVAAAEPAPAKH